MYHEVDNNLAIIHKVLSIFNPIGCFQQEPRFLMLELEPDWHRDARRKDWSPFQKPFNISRKDLFSICSELFPCRSSVASPPPPLSLRGWLWGCYPDICSCCSKLQRAFIACMLFPEVFRKGWRDIVIICQSTGHLLAFALAGVDRPVLSFS